jgi:hypothetical protein
MATEKDRASLEEEVLASTAYQIDGRIKLLGANFFVFARNYQELKRLLKLVQTPKMSMRLWDLENRQELDAVINDVVRLLHNYLAAAKTLVDHTRALVPEWYTGSGFLAEYEAEVAFRFSENPISGFIEGLRNYSLHFSLPFAYATMKVTSSDGERLNQLESGFALSRSTLRQWQKWPAKAYPFLNEAEDEIPLESLVDQYYQQVFDFHSWIEQRLLEIHHDELAWLSMMNQKMISLMPENEKRARGFS